MQQQGAKNMGTALVLLGLAEFYFQDKQEERPEFVCVSVSTVTLREKPNYNSPAIGVAKNGDRLKFIEWQGNWVRVMMPEGNRVAYVSKSAVCDQKKYTPPPPEGSEGASGDIALATKGFTPQMEKERKEKLNLHAAYAKLDRVEARPAYLKNPAMLDQRLATFAREGNLKQ
jgi:hypothetical protein